MEITMVPSQFLSVVLEEDNVSESEEDTNYSNWQNQNSVKMNTVMDQEMWNLTKNLPKALLAECTVEISRTPINQTEAVRKPCFDAKVSPVFRNSQFSTTPQRTNPSIQQYLPPPPQLLHRSEWIEERMDVQDLLTGVEAVYSDNESEGEYEEAASVSIFPIAVNKTDKPKTDKPKKQDLNKFSYPCEHCPNVYSNRGALWQHSVATHSLEKTCECKICGRKFYRNCSLALHLKSHSEEEYCQCKQCGKSFNRLANLERHMRVHTDAEQFPCPSPGCDKLFRDKANLQRHAATHTAGRTLQKAYKDQEHYKTVQTHSETSLGCSTCGDVFTSFAELMQHDATHSAEKVLNNSKKHVMTRHGERLACVICGLDFTQKSSLLRHVKRMHPQESVNIDPALLDGSSESDSFQDTEQEDENKNESLSNVEIRKVLGSPVKTKELNLIEQNAMTNNEKASNTVDITKITNENGSISLEDIIDNKREINLVLNHCDSNNLVKGISQETNSIDNNEIHVVPLDPKQQHLKIDFADPLTSVDINTMHASPAKLET